MEALQQQLIAPAAPPPIGWWPPAPGWWALAAVLLLLSLLVPWLLRRRRRRNRRAARHSARTFPQIPAGLSDSQWLAEINIHLKQALRQRGEEHATRLYGEAWLDYLCRRPGSNRAALQPLAADLYKPRASLTAEQRDALVRELRLWVRHEQR